MNVLVTGGAGYIGSHTCLALIESGHRVIVVDNLCNSSLESIKRVEKLAGKSIHFYQIDLRNAHSLENVFKENFIDAVIHFAGLKAVNESINFPIQYYENNIFTSISLFKLMEKYNCKTIVFSSSATIYGDEAKSPIKESSLLSSNNPYGRSKLIIENILNDIYLSDPTWKIARLRYFNPVGAHKSGIIGENPTGIPNNLFPYISQVAIGIREKINIFGGNYNTHDGTGVRDYIHVVDLAQGHINALEALILKPQLLTLNLGTGEGSSVLDVIKAFESASGKQIPYQIVERREGDVAISFADCSLAQSILNWKSSYSLEEMCKDSWNWQNKNPKGY
tara:strand:+ start:5638 stop:6645 length:1008 start_codon:yes stop_codon:yes gene_type:complete